ncbi:hypothetical protein FQR65_LT17207 [Abscondita terminalis]|nr:hypothetical protein FQR65_LT17207 [Abscondita terminalis]
MFADCSSLNGPANIGSWNTSNVTNMIQLFGRATRFNQDISNWDTQNVTTMAYMFREARAFNQNIGNWNTEKVTDMEAMFENASVFNQDISNWNTANVTNMSKMFSSALVFNQNIGNWNTSKVTNMEGMFQYTRAFNGDISSWNTANVTNMGGMFYSTGAFNQNIGDSPSGIACGRRCYRKMDMGTPEGNQSTPTSLRFGITTLPNKPVSYTWTSSGGSSGSGEIITLSIASEIKAINIAANNSNDNRRLINITQWVDAAWKAQCKMLYAVRSMRKMFNNCQSMTGLANIGSWNTTTVNNMESLFTAARSFNQDIGNWNTANVTNMGYLLSGARAFNQDLSNWNTTNVTNMKEVPETKHHLTKQLSTPKCNLTCRDSLPIHLSSNEDISNGIHYNVPHEQHVETPRP